MDGKKSNLNTDVDVRNTKEKRKKEERKGPQRFRKKETKARKEEGRNRVVFCWMNLWYIIFLSVTC